MSRAALSVQQVGDVLQAESGSAKFGNGFVQVGDGGLGLVADGLCAGDGSTLAGGGGEVAAFGTRGAELVAAGFVGGEGGFGAFADSAGFVFSDGG